MSEVIFCDMASNPKTILRHPPEIVWPYLLDQQAWMKEFMIESVAGNRNEVGEIKKVTPTLAGARPFFFKTLKLTPLREFLYKAYTENRTGQYGFSGIEVLSLSDYGGESAVTFEAYLEIQSSEMTPEELSTFVAQAREGSLAMWERNFQRLGQLVDRTTER